MVEAKKLDFYSNLEEFEQVITQVFELNPHSVHTLSKHKEGIYALSLDNVILVYSTSEDMLTITILKVVYAPDNKQKLRTKEWLEEISKQI